MVGAHHNLHVSRIRVKFIRYLKCVCIYHSNVRDVTDNLLFTKRFCYSNFEKKIPAEKLIYHAFYLSATSYGKVTSTIPSGNTHTHTHT